MVQFSSILVDPLSRQTHLRLFLPGVPNNWISFGRDLRKYQEVLTAFESESFSLTPTVLACFITLNPFIAIPKKI